MSFLDLPNDKLLLLLGISENELDDPAAWCEEMRLVSKAIHAGPKTSDKSHSLMERSNNLSQAIKRKLPEPLSDQEMVDWNSRLDKAKTADDFLDMLKG